MLVTHFVRRYSRELGRKVSEVSPEALERLRAYSWPGNVRELQSVLKQALLHASGTVLLPAFLPELERASAEVAEPPPSHAHWHDLETFIRAQLDAEADDLYDRTHREVDRLLLPIILERTGGNQRDAARLLGISRQTMRIRLRALALRIEYHIKSADPEE